MTRKEYCKLHGISQSYFTVLKRQGKIPSGIESRVWHHHRPHEKTYDQQKRNAAKRGISYLLTYEDWIKIWFDSGHLGKWGRKKGQYHMARFGDVGPYSIDNIKIVTGNENIREALIGNTHLRGFVHTAETRMKNSKAQMGNKNALGLKHTEENKRWIGEHSKALWQNPTFIAKMKARDQRRSENRSTKKQWRTPQIQEIYQCP